MKLIRQMENIFPKISEQFSNSSLSLSRQNLFQDSKNLKMG